jgi:hypothetical protein
MNDLVNKLKSQCIDTYQVDSFNTEKFAELIARECAQVCMSRADRNAILTLFGLPVPSDVKYPAPPVKNSVESQYHRDLQIPGGRG